MAVFADYTKDKYGGKMAKRKNNKQGASKTEMIFAPSDEPYTYFGDQKLNADIHWDIVVTKILAKGYTLGSLAKEVNVEEELLKRLLQKDFSDLRFRFGAHLLGIYTVLYGDGTAIAG
jgi:hypothetical protein